MEIRISNLKTEFNNISLVRSKIMNIFESLKNKSTKLKSMYSDFIKQGNSQLFVFGLDSFHFQSKLIDLEYDDMHRIFLFVNNRMYCEYFKLYKIICSYVIEHITDKKILEIIKGNNFPVYKDLEPFKDYKFQTTIDVHENILVLLNSIASIINNRENELSIHRSKQLTGLNIDNFVNSFNYEITIMREKINLFLSYIEFFHKLHAKYLKRFSNKIQLMSNHINSDIQFDETVENNSTTNVNEDDYELNDDNNIVNIVIDPSNCINIDFENNESGLNTPSNGSHKSYTSFKSIDSNMINDKKHTMSKFIKKGIKKVSNIITGCNNTKTINSVENTQLVLEKLSVNKFNEKLMISLNDFNDNISESEIKLEDSIVFEEDFAVAVEETVVVEEETVVLEEENVVVEEETVVVEEETVVVEEEPVVAVEDIVEKDNFEKETQTEVFYFENLEVKVEEPVVVVEVESVVEEESVVVEEEPVVVVEEPVVVVEVESIVEEESVVVEEEPAVVVVEEPVVVVVEEPVVVEELVVVEEPVVVVEEPVVVEELVVVEEEPVVVVEEEPVVVVEEEPVVVEEEPIVVEEEPVVVEEE